MVCVIVCAIFNTLWILVETVCVPLQLPQSCSCCHMVYKILVTSVSLLFPVLCFRIFSLCCCFQIRVPSGSGSAFFLHLTLFTCISWTSVLAVMRSVPQILRPVYSISSDLFIRLFQICLPADVSPVNSLLLVMCNPFHQVRH